MKKILTILIIVTALILGYILFQQKQDVIPSEEGIQEDQGSQIDTSDWKTYRNKKYGFEFKYPEEWWVTFEYDADLAKLEVADSFLLYRFEFSVIDKMDKVVVNTSGFNRVLDIGEYKVVVKEWGSGLVDSEELSNIEVVLSTLSEY